MSPRALTVVLLVSAAMNVFLIGAAAGLVATHAFAPGGSGGQSPSPLRAAAQELNPADRAALAQLMQDQMQASGPVLLDARKARREARQLMQAQPFDRTATAAALARARADDLQVRGRLEDAVIDFAAGLSPPERAILSAGIMKSQGARGIGRHGFFARIGLSSAPRAPSARP